MKKYRYRFCTILFMLVVMIIFGTIFIIKENVANEYSPKKATLVNQDVIGDMIYGKR